MSLNLAEQMVQILEIHSTLNAGFENKLKSMTEGGWNCAFSSYISYLFSSNIKCIKSNRKKMQGSNDPNTCY